MDKSTHTVAYGNAVIPFQLERRPRSTLAIEVHPDGQVQVIAPENADLEQINAKVIKRGAWILKQQQEFRSYPPPLTTREFVSGETYRYLGRQYRLKVIETDEERTRLWRAHIEVCTRQPNNREHVARHLRNWFRSNAQRVFQERYEYSRKLAKSHGIEHSGGFRLLRMEKRWGSCTPNGKLQLNPALVAASKDCIDYVITHELVHTIEHNHGPRFYKLLSEILPDWEVTRKKLNRLVEPQDI